MMEIDVNNLDKKQLLDDSTFQKLSSIVDEHERTKLETKLIGRAKELACATEFKKLLKSWNKKIKSYVMAFGNEVKLSHKDYDISKFNPGSFVINEGGIIASDNTKFSFFPIFPVEIYKNEDNGKEKVKLIFKKDGKWDEMVVDKSELAVSQKMLRLSDYGIGVNSENVRQYILYFNEVMNLNDIAKLNSVSHIGWKEDNFIPFDRAGIFDGEDDFKNIYKALDKHGSFDIWKKEVDELRKNKVIRMLMATVLASPLLEKLSLQPYMVNAWSSLSGNGKTLSCMVAMSIWGNPDTGALRLSSNNTFNYYITVASFMRNITCYFDELQIIKKNKYFDTEGLVMDLCNQTEKGRLNKNSQAKEVKTWYCNFLFTSNDKLVKENAGEQVYNRVIDLEIREKIVEDGNKTAMIIKNNYGFAGAIYIKYIKELGFEKLQQRYTEIYTDILTKTPATDKQASSLASLLLSDQLITECLFVGEKQLEIADIEEYVNDKDEIRTAMKAKNYIMAVINANYKKFDDVGYGEIWGIKDDYYCTFNSHILDRELKKGGYEFDTVKKEWHEINFLEKSATDRFVHQTTVRRERGSYVRLKLDINNE